MMIPLATAEETEALGTKLVVDTSAPWKTLALYGELGAGKTTLVRGVVRVSSVAAIPAHERKLMSGIDMHGPLSSMGGSRAKAGWLSTAPIVVEATADGFDAVQISIPTSTDPSVAGVMAVARAGAGKAVDFFG